MSSVREVEIYPIASTKGGMINFFTPQSSNETMLVQVPPSTVDDLFVHKTQTDQLLVVKGRLVIVTFINRQYQYIPLSEDKPVVLKIPPGVMHGAINLDTEPCVVVNAVLRHRPAQAKDYIPRERPFSYNLAAVEELLAA